jgi:L-ascorbate metabolism protein UlaG (beta-lactamase superfamily)
MRPDGRLWILAFGILAGCTTVPAPAAGSTETPSSESPPATPAPVSVSIKKYHGNYTCFKIVTSQNIIIVTDPYGMTEDVPADIVTVSHDHSDHNDLSRIQPAVDPIRKPGEYDAKGVHITGVAGSHNKGDTTTTNVIFVFDMDGIRLAQFASQGDMPTAEMFAEIGRVDILIVQIYGNGFDKLSVAEADEIARTLEARIIIPAHTDTSQTEILAALLGTVHEKGNSGFMIVTAAGLAAQQTPRVVTLDTP